MSETTEKLTPEQAELYALEDSGRVVRSLAIEGGLELEWRDPQDLGLVQAAMVRLAIDLKKRAGIEQVCRECACDDEDACILIDGSSCAWKEPDLCSACAMRTEQPPVIEVVSG